MHPIHRRRRTRRLSLALSTTALLGFAPSALADTTVSVENGPFAPGLNGKHVFVHDTPSLFDEPMQVNVVHVSGQFRVTDAVGTMHAGSGCAIVGAEARCTDTGFLGLLIQGGNKSDVLTNSTDLVAQFKGDGGNDDLHGGSVRDFMDGQQGNDDEFGRLGPDVFGAEPGSDRLEGDDGTDTVNYVAATAKVSIQMDDTDANDGIAGEEDRILETEVARGSRFGDNIDGSNEPNTLAGNGGDDHIRGRNGDDRMDGGDGADIIDGDDGTDTANYESRVAGVNVTLDNNDDDGNAADGPAGARDDVTDQTENVEGGAGNDALAGTSVANELIGNGGADILSGGGGDDVLDGGIGSDTLNGSAGSDSLDGGPQDDTLDGGDANDVIDGGDDADRLLYQSRTEDITVTLDSGTADDGGATDDVAGVRDDARNVEKVTTGSGNDVVTGDASAEEFVTNDGDDTLIGNEGPDTLTGGPGNDGLSGGPGLDKLNTKDDETDAPIPPISCGEDLDEPVLDELIADIEDVFANPDVTVLGNPAECEVITAT